MVINFGIIAIDSSKGKEIDLYSDYIENRLQVIKFVAIHCSLHLSTKLEFG